MEFKNKVAGIVENYVDIVRGTGGREEIDEFEAKKIKIDSKILGLKNAGSAVNDLKNKAKLDYEESKLKFV